MDKDKKTLKDNELKNVTGGAINDGDFIQGTPFASLKEDLRVPKELKIVDNRAFSAVDPVSLKPDSEKTEEEKATFIPIPY